MHANALVTLAGVLVSAGQEADADAALGEAQQLYEQKGNLAAAAWLRAAATGVNSGQL
jgi:hypothetical protein